MLFYRCNEDYHDYFTGHSCVKGELLTKQERDIKYRYLSDECFDIVKIPFNKTFRSFGVRFPFHSEAVVLVNDSQDKLPKFFEIDNVRFCFSLNSFYKRNEYDAKYSLSRYDEYLGWITMAFPRNYTDAVLYAKDWLNFV